MMSDWNSGKRWIVHSMVVATLAVHATAQAEPEPSRCGMAAQVSQACNADADRKEAQKEMTAAQTRYRDALARQNAAKSKVNDLRSKLDPLFKASQPYRKAALEVSESMKNSQKVHREEVEKVRQTEAYRKQKAQRDTADATIKRLGDKVEFQDPTLQAALKATGAAASAMANMEAQVVLTNARYREASDRAKAAEKQREDARKAFDAEQEKKPELAAALKGLADAERESKEAEKAADAAKVKFDKTIRP